MTVGSEPVLSSTPIFVGGDHRSGTTLLSVMLDSHPDIVHGPELDFLEPQNLGSHVLECVELLRHGDDRVAGKGVETADPHWQLGVQFVRQCHRFGVTAETLGALVAEQISATGSDISTFEARCTLIDAVGEWRRRQAGVSRWGLKIQRSVAIGDAFARLWPRAAFIHVVRDGRDVAASHLRGGQAWAYRTITEAAEGWVRVVDGAAASLPAGRSVEVRYEDLVLRTAATLRRLLAKLEVPWDDAVLHHASMPHTLFDHPYEHPTADAAGREVFVAAVGRHRADLSYDELVRFEAIAGKTLDRLGYRDGRAERSS